jgi:hypothetical protein
MNGETAMKTITSALVALLVIAGVAGTAQALDAKTWSIAITTNKPSLQLAPHLPCPRSEMSPQASGDAA